MTNPMYSYTVDSMGYIPRRDEVFDSPCGRAHCRSVQVLSRWRYLITCELMPLRYHKGGTNVTKHRNQV